MMKFWVKGGNIELQWERSEELYVSDLGCKVGYNDSRLGKYRFWGSDSDLFTRWGFTYIWSDKYFTLEVPFWFVTLLLVICSFFIWRRPRTKIDPQKTFPVMGVEPKVQEPVCDQRPRYEDRPQFRQR